MLENGSNPYYRELLTRELEKRSAKNPRYSLRSFARDLKVSPQRLSDLIRGRYGLSVAQATLLADELNLSVTERNCFISSAEMLHARSAQRRKKAASEFEFHRENFKTVGLDAFKVISDWYHYAILELTYLKDFESNISCIAAKLGISEFVAEQAVERLERLEMLERDSKGKWVATEEFVATPSGIPSEDLKKFHRMLLEKALLALDLQTVKQRDFASVIVAIDKSRLPEAQEDLKRFRREFTKKYGTQTESHDEVYCLGQQFFKLTEETNLEKKMKGKLK